MDKNIGEDDVFEEELDELDLEDSTSEPVSKPMAPMVNGADDDLQPMPQQPRGRGRPPRVQPQVQPAQARPVQPVQPVQQQAKQAQVQEQAQVEQPQLSVDQYLAILFNRVEDLLTRVTKIESDLYRQR